MQSLSVVSSSKHLPISIEEAKLFLKITNIEEDGLIKRMIESASATFESYTSKALLVKEWKVICNNLIKTELTLPIRYVRKINSVTLIDIYGRKHLLHHSSFSLAADIITFHTPPFSHLTEIVFEAGIALIPDELDPSIKELLLEHVAHLYENRVSGHSFDLNKYNQFREIKL